MRGVWLALLALTAACGRGGAPGAPADYSPSDRSFSASVPAGWRVDDEALGARKAAFYGPPEGVAPFSQSISVSFFGKGGRWSSARAYLEAQRAAAGGPPQPPLAPGVAETEFRRSSLSRHGGAAEEQVRLVAVEGRDGFFVLQLTRPAGAAAAPAFDAFVASFKPAR